MSETRERTLHGQEQNRMHMASMRESRDSDRFLVNTQVQSHALLRRGFDTSVPFIVLVAIAVLKTAKESKDIFPATTATVKHFENSFQGACLLCNR